MIRILLVDSLTERLQTVRAMLPDSEYHLRVCENLDSDGCEQALKEGHIDAVLLASSWAEDSRLGIRPWSAYPTVILATEKYQYQPGAVGIDPLEVILDAELSPTLLQRTIEFSIRKFRSEQRWLQRVELEKAVADFSQLLVAWSGEPLKPLLRKLGDTISADSVAIYRMNDTLTEAAVTEEWYRLPEWSLANAMPIVKTVDFGDWSDRFLARECILLDLSKDPGESNTRQAAALKALGINAGVWVPIVDHTGCFRGCMVITNSLQQKGWVKEDIHSLRMIGEMIGAAWERADTNTAQTASEENYRLLVEYANEAIFVAREGRLLYFNDKLCTFLGVPREVLAERSYLEYVHPDDRQMLIDRHRRRLAGEDLPGRYSFRLTDGSHQTIWVELNVVSINWQGQGAALCFLNEITARKQAEDQLRESQQQFRSLYNNALVGLFRTAIEDGRILAINERTATMFGFEDPDEMISLGTMASFYVEAGVRETMLKALRETGHVDNFETSFRRRDGSTFWARFSARSFPDRGILEGVITDISEEKATRQALTESQAKYRELFKSVQEGIGLVDQSEVIEFCNPAWAMIFDASSPEELIGRSLLDFVDDTNREIMLRQTDQRRLLNASRYELEITTDAGNRKTIAVSVSPRCDRSGNYLGSFGTVLDITDRRRTEEALRESEERLKIILESVNTAILTIDPERLEVVDANVAAETILGIDRDRLIGMSCVKAICASNECPDGGTCMQQTVKNLETEITRPDGTRITILKSAVEVQLNGRRHLVESFIDLTELKQRERELHKLSAAVGQSPIMIVITDPKGIIEYVNPHFTDVTGYRQDEVLGKTPAILYSGRQPDNLYEGMWQTIKGGGTWIGKMQNRRKNGEYYWERKSISPIFDSNGDILNFLSIGTDITNDIISQQKLAESDKLSAIGMLAAGVAHEFKNYLGGIIGNASFALEQIDDTDSETTARETLQQIVDIGYKANEVAMSLLSYSKAKPNDLTRESLAKLIEQSIGLVGKELRNRTIEIANYIEDVPPFEMSASKIQQLFLNLLINAQHAIQSNGVITVALLNGGDRAIIKVGDSGDGISEDKLEQIFDPFYSTKGVWGKDEVVGTGMGLSISRNIAREHGGDITAQSIVGVGSTFTVTIPINGADSKLPSRRRDEEQHTIVFFTLDKLVTSRYHQYACETNTRLLVVDNAADAPLRSGREIDLVVCDAHFAGKVELLQVAQMCIEHSIPYVMANCNIMEYQLSEIYDGSAATFPDLPDLDQLLAVITSDRELPANG